MDKLEREYRLKKIEYSLTEYTTMSDIDRLYSALSEMLKLVKDISEKMDDY